MDARACNVGGRLAQEAAHHRCWHRMALQLHALRHHLLNGDANYLRACRVDKRPTAVAAVDRRVNRESQSSTHRVRVLLHLHTAYSPLGDAAGGTADGVSNHADLVRDVRERVPRGYLQRNDLRQRARILHDKERQVGLVQDGGHARGELLAAEAVRAPLHLQVPRIRHDMCGRQHAGRARPQQDHGPGARGALDVPRLPRYHPTRSLLRAENLHHGTAGIMRSTRCRHGRTEASKWG
mmetsp:Transcript_50310/g.155481  ORF Transcript_50310/g.155481 Transcript_50310/m.155481 type:complete len:238 (+) Transcript_50310:903-1616(+)